MQIASGKVVNGQVIVEAQSAEPEPESESEATEPAVEQSTAEFTGDMLRIRMSPETARAFSKRAQNPLARRKVW